MSDYENYMYTPSCPLCKFFGDESGVCEKCKHRKTYLEEKEKMMSDEELRNYLAGNPTIKGIVTEMKTWWSNEGSDKILQECFDAILRIDGERKDDE